MNFNNKIIEIFKEYKIFPDDGLGYLLSLYYGCNPTYIPDIIKQKINLTKIVEFKDCSIQWNIPLFEGQETKFDWVSSEYIKLFKDFNPSIPPHTKECISRMKKFFAENPDVRKDDIIGATRLYINSLSNPTYLRRPHYFINKGKGLDKISDLMSWLEVYYESEENSTGRNSITNTLQ